MRPDIPPKLAFRFTFASSPFVVGTVPGFPWFYAAFAGFAVLPEWAGLSPDVRGDKHPQLTAKLNFSSLKPRAECVP